MTNANDASNFEAEWVRRERRQRLIMGGIFVGLLTAGAVGWVLLAPNKHEQLMEKIPADVDFVGWIDVESILERPEIKRLLEDEDTAMALKQVSEEYGIDAESIETMAMGVKFDGMGVEMIVLASGDGIGAGVLKLLRDMKDKADGMGIDSPYPERTIDGKVFYRVRSGELGPEMYAGAFDSDVLVMGSASLIEKSLAGGDSVLDNETLAAQLDETSSAALLAGAGVMPENPFIADALQGAVFRTELLWDGDEAELRYTYSFDSAEAAQKAAEAKDQLLMGMDVMGSTTPGVHVSKPLIRVDGTVVEVSVTVDTARLASL